MMIFHIQSIRRGSAIFAASLLLGYAIGALAQEGPKPILRLNLSKEYPQYKIIVSQGDGPLFLYRGQLVLIRGHLDNTSNSLASEDQGKTWHPWEAYHTWPKILYSDVLHWENEYLAFGAINIDSQTVSAIDASTPDSD